MSQLLPAVVYLSEYLHYRSEHAEQPDFLEGYISSRPSGKYYLRYGLIKKDGSGISDNAKKFIEKNKAGEDLKDIVKEILFKRTVGNGAWISLFEYGAHDKNRDCFEFEANGKKDATYIYAKFLFDLGILDIDPDECTEDVNKGYFSVQYSDLGKTIIIDLANRVRIVRVPEGVTQVENQAITMIQHNDNRSYSHNTGGLAVFGGIRGGRENDQSSS